MVRTFVLFTALLVGLASATNVRECTKDRPLPLSVIVEGCETMPCDIVKGTTAVMNVHFVGTRDNIQTITAKVRATALGITAPYELPKDVANVCANLLYGASCPIYNTEDVTYIFKFPIESSYPEISVKVEVSLIDDETSESLACFVCDIKVKKGSTAPAALN